jgi:hypothetical protein
MGNYFSCRYTSMGQCRLAASDRAAQRIVNPYFAGGRRAGRLAAAPHVEGAGGEESVVRD